jgi:anti-anti-sigma regulatory factor
VDLTGVDYVDTAGRYLLALMHQAGARFVASGCAILALVEEIETRGAV